MNINQIEIITRVLPELEGAIYDPFIPNLPGSEPQDEEEINYFRKRIAMGPRCREIAPAAQIFLSRIGINAMVTETHANDVMQHNFLSYDENKDTDQENAIIIDPTYLQFYDFRTYGLPYDAPNIFVGERYKAIELVSKPPFDAEPLAASLYSLETLTGVVKL